MPSPVPDWQLPAGVSRGVWEYTQDPNLARGYDDSLTGSTLCQADLRFVERYCQPPGRLLDLGCGSGRLLSHGAALGYRLVGVDLSEPMLRVAREKTRDARDSVHLVKANIADLRGFADESFDHAACLFSTLGMVTGAGHRDAVLRHALRLVRPRGRLVLHVHNRWFHVWTPGGRRWLVDDMMNRWRLSDEACDGVASGRAAGGLRLRHFSRGEILRRLRQVGWRVLRTEPVGLGPGGRLSAPWWLGGVRAYGYLVAAERPGR